MGQSQRRNVTTPAEQGAAPDRLQPALWSFLPSLRLPAAGELGVVLLARGVIAGTKLKMLK